MGLYKVGNYNQDRATKGPYFMWKYNLKKISNNNKINHKAYRKGNLPFLSLIVMFPFSIDPSHDIFFPYMLSFLLWVHISEDFNCKNSVRAMSREPFSRDDYVFSENGC